MIQQESEVIFDAKHYESLNAVRCETFERVFTPLRNQLGLKTAVDIGCGIGYFTNFLSQLGLDVLGVDGRKENVLEARGRYPNLKFEVMDAQDPGLSSFGEFDMVFCYGLLYHLENPFVTIRSIAKMARKFVAVEGVVYPSAEPILVLLQEGDSRDQGLNYVAFYPSETALVQMLSTSGFPACYWPTAFPKHADFEISGNGFRQRTFLFAAQSDVQSDSLTKWRGTASNLSPWGMAPLYPVPTAVSKLYSFVHGKLRAITKQLGFR